jgi:hypothetical protein
VREPGHIRVAVYGKAVLRDHSVHRDTCMWMREKKAAVWRLELELNVQ